MMISELWTTITIQIQYVDGRAEHMTDTTRHQSGGAPPPPPSTRTCWIHPCTNQMRTKALRAQRRDIQRGNRHLDNLNFCVTRSTRHAKSSSQCRRWNFIAKDRENAVRKVKIAFFLKMRYPWKFCSINYCRITVSDHFYWFPFIKSVNVTIYFAKVCFFPIYSLLKSWKALAGIFRCSCIKNKAANDINASKYNSCIKKT